MKNLFQPGDGKTYMVTVRPEDAAAFSAGAVHPVYSTFALARDAEWCCRLFVLEMKEEDEEGIGTLLEVEHLSPALIGSEVVFTATVESVTGNNIICTFEAHCGDRLVAKGRQGQKILPKTKLQELFQKISSL